MSNPKVTIEFVDDDHRQRFIDWFTCEGDQRFGEAIMPRMDGEWFCLDQNYDEPDPVFSYREYAPGEI